MLKRIFVLCCVLMIVFSCTLPCFAAGGAGTLYYSSFPIDVIRLNNGDKSGSFVEWPFNVASESSFDYGSDAVWAEGRATWITGNTPIIEGAMNLGGGATSFSLISHLTYLDSQTSFVLSYDDMPTDITFTRIVIEYDLVGVEQYDTSGFYYGDLKHIYYDSSADGGLGGVHELDIVSYIKRAYKSQVGKDLNVGHHKLLQSLEVRIDFYYDSDPYAFRNLYVKIKADNNPGQVIPDWVSSLNIHSDVPIGDFDPLGWLVDIIENFLQFELFPGFSLDTLLNLIIILTVVLVILKIVS